MDPMTPPRPYPALTPLDFLERAARMFSDRVAVIDGDERLTYAELHDDVRRQAATLTALGVKPGDRVAVLAPNTRGLLEAHYSVPWGGAVLVALNARLNARELAAIVEHAGAELLLYDQELADVAAEIGAAQRLALGALVQRSRDEAPAERVAAGEYDLLSLNYTSGTTGRPKGVMYHHRGAYLQALAMAYHARLAPGAAYLWTLPMFHCNGWCFTWAVTAAGGTHVCLRRVDPAAIWQRLRQDGITHLCGAPTVLTMIGSDHAAAEGPLPHTVWVGTGGAPPTPSLLEEMGRLNFAIAHLYGLTETFGPVVACDWQPEWDAEPAAQRARLAARQGNVNILSGALRVRGEDGRDVAADGEALGEVQIRANDVMLGYYRDLEATAAAFTADGWFRTGDVAVMHPDSYFELRDRAKDVIISGGENITSVEVEQAIASHPAVSEVAVVAAPDEHWGEIPVAYVELRAGRDASEDEIRAHVREHLAGFKVPKRVIFTELPKTSTGKIQKTVLRERSLTLAPRSARR